MAERVAAHREALLVQAEMSRDRAAQRHARITAWTATQRSATGLPVAGGRTVRRSRPIGERVGSWLTEAGTRLGGSLSAS
jgi:hypothetical protein